MKPYRHLALCLLALSALFLAACGSPPTAEEVSIPTAVSAQPTSATAAEAPTEIPPTPTMEATLPPPPTVAAPPTTTPSPTPEATATPDDVVLLSLEDFGTDRNPLTGELVADAEVLNRLPIACKITNHPPQYTRPQSGINQADIIFEHINLWSSTRFTAIWYDQTPSEVGPIRSARLIDKELPAMYHAALCFSGANVGVSQTLFASDIRAQILRSNVDGYYRIDAPERPSEHTLYADPSMLWDELDNREFDHRPNFVNAPVFDTRPQEGGEAVSKITLELIDEEAYWEYQPDNGRYWRWSDGEPHRDALNDEQLSAKNVIVLFVPHIDNVSICAVPNEDGSCAAYSIEIQLWGSNRAWIFRDGQMYKGKWVRQGRGDMLTFIKDSGEAIPLQIGNIFFQVMPATWDSHVTVEP